MQGVLCAQCGWFLGEQTPRTACDVCGLAMLCLRCASASDGEGLAVCGECKEQQESLASTYVEAAAKVARLHPCSGCANVSVRVQVRCCPHCSLYYCGDCYDKMARHRCVVCGIEGCTSLSDRRITTADGQIVPAPSVDCCGTGPLCHQHRRLHRAGGACMAAHDVHCGRCREPLRRWLLCRHVFCSGVHACPTCKGLCSQHLEPEPARCGCCARRYFCAPLEAAGRVREFGYMCCEDCFARLRTAIDCMWMRLRGPGLRRPVPKDVMALLLRCIKYG